MEALNKYVSLVEKGLREMDLPEKPSALYEPVRYILEIGGKRIRPALTLLTCALYGADPLKYLNVALGIEVFHNFTLLHDDIMDQAPRRRNLPTVHEKWNVNVAILSGDAMFVKAMQLLVADLEGDKLKKVLGIFNKTALEVCEGQQLDMDYESLSTVSISDYEEMIRLKTAVLLASSFYIGAICADASEKDADLLYDFGQQLGLAFQLQDDLLDVYGDAEKFGKAVGGDISSNKKTFLLLKAFELADVRQRKNLSSLIFEDAQRGPEKVKAVTGIYDEIGIKDLVEKEIREFYSASLKSLNQCSLAPEKKDVLKDFASQLIGRQY